MHYTLQVVYLPELKEHCLFIKNEATGKYLNQFEYENWIKLVGGTEKISF
ncbi:hypothetical protein J7E63_15675 [Bacillus sp. ISL-75]|nr:hypothetical protein [Bacillus sp. ISL-75]MBT2728370.1 hypothetical protein [Bacillus sp. ISL-75]